MMKMLEEIKCYRKDWVFDNYSRIIENFKDYEKISKVKMIEEVYNKVYSDYKNIIDICTTRELKYLKMYFDNDLRYKDKKYAWERHTLHDKFIASTHYPDYEIMIPDEIYENVKKAVDNVNWIETKKKDEINEFLVSFAKIQGSCLVSDLVQIGAVLLSKTNDEIVEHVLSNRVFKYYVWIIEKDYEILGKDVPIAVFQDYYDLVDEIDEARRLQGKAFSSEINFEDYKALFYNDFNINNSVIKKFYNELIELPFFYTSAIPLIKKCALLNSDRSDLKTAIKNVPRLKNYDLTKFFKLMDKAMDEMMSGALYGLTPNELKKIEEKEISEKKEKEEKYVRQGDACLTKREAKLFYKIYFALLEFTNRKFNIKPGYKIYDRTGINPYDIKDIVEKFWENKDVIILEFCMGNPYKFNKEEIRMVNDFKKGIRDIFIIVEYKEEYTAVMNQDKAFMIKGINSNIDQVVPYEQLPYITRTSIIPFGDRLIYDGLFLSYEIDLGMNFRNVVNKEYKRAIKHYHL